MILLLVIQLLTLWYAIKLHHHHHHTAAAAAAAAALG
jgi:hypothetical protein